MSGAGCLHVLLLFISAFLVGKDDMVDTLLGCIYNQLARHALEVLDSSIHYFKGSQKQKGGGGERLIYFSEKRIMCIGRDRE